MTVLHDRRRHPLESAGSVLFLFFFAQNASGSAEESFQSDLSSKDSNSECYFSLLGFTSPPCFQASSTTTVLLEVTKSTAQ